MKQVDDGRPGMAFELGVNIFADGNPVLNVCITLNILGIRDLRSTHSVRVDPKFSEFFSWSWYEKFITVLRPAGSSPNPCFEL